MLLPLIVIRQLLAHVRREIRVTRNPESESLAATVAELVQLQEVSTCVHA